MKTKGCSKDKCVSVCQIKMDFVLVSICQINRNRGNKMLYLIIFQLTWLQNIFLTNILWEFAEHAYCIKKCGLKSWRKHKKRNEKQHCLLCHNFILFFILNKYVILLHVDIILVFVSGSYWAVLSATWTWSPSSPATCSSSWDSGSWWVQTIFQRRCLSRFGGISSLFSI